ncbi:FtsX-like permease family protein [Lihuaxuella thermophila]|nr:ABC transporter permease [Lihuaxuella thermophila]
MDTKVAAGFHLAETVIYLFSVLFIWFSMRAFLKSREHQFKLFLTFGMTPGQLKLMIFLEHMLIGLIGTMTGLTLSLSFVKMVLLIAENVVGLDFRLYFYFPMKALALTFGAFIALFAVLSVCAGLFLDRERWILFPQQWNKQSSKEPNASRPLAVSAPIFLAGGYGMALSLPESPSTFMIVCVVVSEAIGTYFLFDQLGVCIIHTYKRNRHFFWRRTNLLLLSDLANRMKDCARTLFMISILFMIAMTAIGMMAGYQGMIKNRISQENPFALVYASSSGNMRETKDVAEIERALEEHGIPFQRLQATIKELPIAKSNNSLRIIPASEFNAIARAAGNVAVAPTGTQAILVPNDDSQGPVQGTGGSTLRVGLLALQVTGVMEAYSFPDFDSYLVVSDDVYALLNDYTRKVSFHLFDVDDWRQTEGVARQLKQRFGPTGEGKVDFTFFSLTYTLGKIRQVYGGSLFALFFIGAVFFAASWSFLYFRLYTNLQEDQRKFAVMNTIGLTDQELSKVITLQLILLIFTPFFVALVHSSFAMMILQHAIQYNLMKETMAVLGAFLTAHVFYFAAVRSAYVKRVKQSITYP